MANKIILKKTSTASKVPLSSDLEVGEIAVNLADQKLYTKNAGGTVILVGSGTGGTGDVVGPSSATDNALVRFDTTTGKLIQNGTVTQDDNGSLENVNAVVFDTTPTSVPTTAGTMAWDTGNGTPSIVLDADVSLQLGQEQLALVYNGTGSTITNGSVVAVTGAQGARPSVVLADADSESLSANTLGIATEDIANGAEGFVTTFGFIRGLNTSAYTAGNPIYLSQTAGAFTATRPTAPAHTVILGWVIKVNASSGEVFVNINNGWELDELHNVNISSPTGGQLLAYDQTNSYWKNITLTDGTGINITETTGGAITIANTGVTSVGATAPIASSGGATPTISISQASSTTNGYLSSTDWNTFNNKTSNTGTVTSVAMTVPTGLSISGTPITTSGTLALTLTAGYSIPTTASQTNWDSAYTQRLQWDGGSTNLVAATGRTSLGGTTVGQNFFTLTNPTAVTFPRINADNTVSALDAATFRSAIGAGTGSGTVTSITAGTGLSGGTITTSGTISLANTAVTAGSYTYASITVDAQGRLTSASSGTAPVTSVSGTAGRVTSSGGTTPTIDLATSGVTANTYGSSSAIPVITVDAYGRATSITTATVAGGQYFGSAAVKAIAYNANSISENVTVTAGNNGLSAGPITINTGYTVTVETGAVWVIV